jgi:hypothetical protein
MDINRILADLHAERDRLDRAITALTGVNSSGRTTRTPVKTAPRGRRRMTAAGRKRLSELLKKRWASGKMGKRRKMKGA